MPIPRETNKQKQPNKQPDLTKPQYTNLTEMQEEKRNYLQQSEQSEQSEQPAEQASYCSAQTLNKNRAEKSRKPACDIRENLWFRDLSKKIISISHCFCSFLYFGEEK